MPFVLLFGGQEATRQANSRQRSPCVKAGPKYEQQGAQARMFLKPTGGTTEWSARCADGTVEWPAIVEWHRGAVCKSFTQEPGQKGLPHQGLPNVCGVSRRRLIPARYERREFGRRVALVGHRVEGAADAVVPTVTDG